MSSIEVRASGKVHTVSVNDNETLLAALRKAGFSVPAACGGICTSVRSGRRICRCIAAPAVPGHSLRNRRGDFSRSSRR